MPEDTGVVDPKGTDFEKYCGATLLTPNRVEFEAVCGSWTNEQDLIDKGLTLIKRPDIGGNIGHSL